MVKVQLVEAGSYSTKLNAFYFLLLLDIVLNSFSYFLDLSDSEYASSNDMLIGFVFFGVQALIQIVIFSWVFFLIWQTFLFRFGLIGILCREFKLLFISIPVNFLLFAGEKAFRLALMLGGTDPIEIYDDITYDIVLGVRAIFLVYFYVLLIEMSLILGDPEYYKPHKWLNP